MLPLRASMDQGDMAMKGYSAFTEAPTSPSDCLVSYPGHLLRKSYFSAEKQSVYSTSIFKSLEIFKEFWPISKILQLVAKITLITMSCSSCITPLLSVQSVPLTIGITVIFMFHSFFCFFLVLQQGLCIYLSGWLVGWLVG